MVTHTNGPLARRAGPLLGALLLVAATLLVAMPVAPGASAIDPTPTPSGAPSPSPDPIPPSPDPAPTPSPDPSPDPAPTPSPDPSTAPVSTPSPDPSTAPVPDPSPTPAATPIATPAPSPVDPLATPQPPSPGGLAIEHTWVDTVLADGTLRPGPIDSALDGLERFRVYELRFQVVNAGPGDVTLDPTLQIGLAGGAAAFSPVPTAVEADAAPFILAPDDGRVDRPRVEPLARAALRLTVASPAGAVATDGIASYGLDPGAVLVLPPHTFTEVTVAIRATAAAAWRTTYTFRLTVAGSAGTATGSTAVTLTPKPTIQLSAGQRRGIVVSDPVPLYRLQQPDPSQRSTAVTAFALLAPSAQAPVTPHEIAGLTSDTCAACHASHAAQGSLLLQAAGPDSNLCFRCHDGVGATSDVKGRYADPAVPANDPATASWYSHPATTPSDHTSDRVDEFGGRLDRHAACADCHQPHLADGGTPTQTTAGWTASGAIKGASGVSVVNGAAGTSPAYTWMPGSTLEYELCFKCHSGFTQLPAADPAHPSHWSLDKGIELDPANASYHPIEAAGKNATTAMTNSLAGTSPYKLWTFQTDATIRCVSCHGDPASATPSSPPAAGAQLASHTSPNRSLLMSPYRDRQLKPAGASYDATDFALCYQCHAESPMVDFSGDPNGATNFRYHGYHLTAIDGEGNGGTDIDVAGQGEGNAICAECHFRIHGSALAVGGQPDNARLVNFAPNVQPYRGVLTWTGGATGGSCTLICHGITHSNWRY